VQAAPSSRLQIASLTKGLHWRVGRRRTDRSGLRLDHIIDWRGPYG
jgi:hypothetical protein